MRVAIYVLADAFIPLMFNIGENLRAKCGHDVEYLSFAPRDHRWLRKITTHITPNNPNKLPKTGTSPFLPNEDALRLSAFMQIKHGGSPEEWIARNQSIANELHDFITRFKPQLFILWNNEDHVGQIICNFAKKFGFQTIIMENGYFPNTLQIDPIGVNANSSATTISFNEIQGCAKSKAEEHRKYFDAESFDPKGLTPFDYAISFARRILSPRYYEKFPEHRGSSWIHKKRIEAARKRIKVVPQEIPQSYIFIPLQVHDDTQVVLNGQHFDSVESFLTCARSDIRKALGPEVSIVVKEHPEDLCRYDFSKIRNKFPDLVWLQNGNTDQLLRNARAIAVLNSSVGLQAIQLKKPTVVYGKCFYARREVCFPVTNLSDAPELIKLAYQAELPPDVLNNIDDFINYLKSQFFVSGTWRNVNTACVSNACRKILEIVNENSNKKNS